MADLSDAIRDEVEELRGLRDDLRLQIHLAKMEAQERWEKAEEDWDNLEAKLSQVASESREAMEDVGQAVKLLVGEIRDGYRHIRDLL